MSFNLDLRKLVYQHTLVIFCVDSVMSKPRSAAAVLTRLYCQLKAIFSHDLQAIKGAIVLAFNGSFTV